MKERSIDHITSSLSQPMFKIHAMRREEKCRCLSLWSALIGEGGIMLHFLCETARNDSKPVGLEAADWSIGHSSDITPGNGHTLSTVIEKVQSKKVRNKIT